MIARYASIVSCALLCAFAGAAGAADQEPFFRPCEKADVTGLWRMENIDEKPQGDETTVFKIQLPYQYIFFDSDGRYYYAMANMEYGDEKNAIALTKIAMADAGYFYNTETKGRVIIRDAKKVANQYSCNVALKSAYPYTKGNLVLGEAVQSPVPASVIRIYRRLYTKK